MGPDMAQERSDRMEALRHNRELVRRMPQWKRDAHAVLRPRAYAAESETPRQKLQRSIRENVERLGELPKWAREAISTGHVFLSCEARP